MKKVLISARRFQKEGTMFGAGGEYTVSDITAKQIVNEGKGTITEDLGEDYVEPSYDESQEKAKFIGMVREHASEIMEILEKVHQEKMDNRSKSFDGAYPGHTGGISPSKTNPENEEETEVSKSQSSKGGAKETPKNDSEDDKDETSAKNGGSGTSDKDKDNDENKDNEEGNDDHDDEPSGTLLPQHFPSKEVLEAAGLKTIESIPRDKNELLRIVPDLKERSLNAIGVRLSEIDDLK